ncbi:DNA-directed RNA polymerase subunit alpha [Mollicutes bacterium LVI A0039]|nr:DNA-directed RNA polymerase subunit alpha [Mollicutes bacterium LVI A0039]
MMNTYDFNIVFPSVKIIEDETNPHRKQFVIEPLENGFGITVGNALRRIALSTLPGGAVKKIKIAGVAHEFDTINGARDEVTSVVLAVKDLNVRISNQEEEVTLRLSGNKKGDLLAGDIECPEGVEIINKDLRIVTLTEDVDFEMELLVAKGRGYVLAEENRNKEKKANEIYVDSIFTPVERFSYEVTDTRVGDKTNYDKLIIDIETNGMLTPEEAISYSAHIMKEHTLLLENLEETINKSIVFNEAAQAALAEETDESKEEETSIETLDISNRAYNGLKRANINTIEELAKHSKKEISGLDNIGSKTVDEIEQQLTDLGIKFREE